MIWRYVVFFFFVPFQFFPEFVDSFCAVSLFLVYERRGKEKTLN
jgi:hypothetical protein